MTFLLLDSDNYDLPTAFQKGRVTSLPLARRGYVLPAACQQGSYSSSRSLTEREYDLPTAC